MKKTFKTYEEAYALYSDIVAGRDPDRKDASIFYRQGTSEVFEGYIVQWSEKK